MVSIIQAQEEKRRNKINCIAGSVRNAFEAHLEVSQSKLLNEFCLEFGASKRHVLELMNIALTSIPHKIIRKNGDVLLHPKEEIIPPDAPNEQILTPEEEQALN